MLECILWYVDYTSNKAVLKNRKKKERQRGRKKSRNALTKVSFPLG